jgi:PAS domain S-box-containing protein
MKQVKKKKASKASAENKKESGQKGQEKEEKKLRVLILEDNAVDAELMERQLKKESIAFVSRRVESKSNYLQALKTFQPDLILADYKLPKFDALRALAIRNKMAPRSAFIIVTGTVSEESAVECMKRGADDYLLKDRMARLGEAVIHVLKTRRLQEEKTRTEATLHDHEQMYRTFIDAGSDMAFLKDDKFRHLWANRELCRFYKKAEKEIIGKTDAELMTRSAAARCRKTDRQALAENRAHVSEETVGGLTFETRKFPVKLADGGMGVGGYIRDISASKRQLEMIEQSSKKWFTTFDSILDGILLLGADQTVLQANQAFADMVKKPFKAIIGKKCYELVHADRRPDPQCPFARSSKSKKRELMELEINGRIFRIVTDPLKQDSGAFSGAVHVMTDITEHKRNQELLQATSKRLQVALHSAKAGTWDWDVVSSHIEWSPQMFDLFGLDPRTASASFASWRKALHPEDRELAENRIDLALKQHATLDSEYRIVLPDGQIRWINATGVGVYDDAERPIQMIGICQDISERKLVENAMIESEERYRDLVENSQDLIFTHDLEGKLLSANAMTVRLIGYPIKDLLSKNIADLLVPEVRHLFSAYMTEIRSTGWARGRMRIRTAGGENRYWEYDNTLRTKGVTVPIVRGLAHDITERKRAEEALQEMSTIFRLFLKHNPIYVFIKDENIRPIYLSENYEKMLGRPLDDILGKNMDELFPSELSRAMIEDDKRILREGKSREFIEELNGRTYSTLKFPISIDGKPKYLAGYTTDITERRQTEDALQENQARLNAFMDFVPSLILIKDHELRPIYANEAMRQNFPIAEWLGKKPHELFPAGVADLMVSKDNEALGKGFTIYEEDWIDRFEQQRFFLTQKFRIDRPHKEPLLGAIISDISERKQAENRLKASLLEKEILLKEIHHRVKNNLQVISGLLTLQAAQINDERFQRMIKESQGRIWTMALIHQTLYQSGNLADIDMSDYISTLSGNLLSSHAQVAMPPNIRFDLLPLRLSIDKAIPLALIINELLTNALKHAFPDGRAGEIRITLREGRGKSRRAPSANTDPTPVEDTVRSPHAYELIVTDDGVGLPAGFDLKNQKSLGLQLVAMLTQQLDGSFIAANEAGAVFRVSFDLHEKKE